MPWESWESYKRWLFDEPELRFRMDLSRTGLGRATLEKMEPELQNAYTAMQALESGAIANPDEQRMVGHYWLRAPALAPEPEIRTAIESTLERLLRFAAQVHAGEVAPFLGGRFDNLLVVGIGGSALGPQFVGDALGGTEDRLRPHFLDNTDPDGIDRVLGGLGEGLARTLTIVISKSGGTPETRNAMLEAQRAYRTAGLELGPHAVAITQEGSKLDRFAADEGFLARFPMWDWVGGRTSETSAVGLLPAALQGIDVRALLEGAAAMDRATRRSETVRNPAGLLALTWYHATDGRGAKDMVLLPYKDRLALLGRYLQQLVMESLGKELDLEGNEVNQGIAVYGNKGSTDQHAYVQQLREGVANFFVTFVEVLHDRDGEELEVEPGITAGDYLAGFRLGTRQALWENGRTSITLTVPDVSPRSVGMLIALYERAVGLYASLVDINAYHQPGVEAGKRAAASVLELQRRALAALTELGETGATCEELARRIETPEQVETLFQILERLAANPGRGVLRSAGSGPFDARYSKR